MKSALKQTPVPTQPEPVRLPPPSKKPSGLQITPSRRPSGQIKEESSTSPAVHSSGALMTRRSTDVPRGRFLSRMNDLEAQLLDMQSGMSAAAEERTRLRGCVLTMVGLLAVALALLVLLLLAPPAASPAGATSMPPAEMLDLWSSAAPLGASLRANALLVVGVFVAIALGASAWALDPEGIRQLALTLQMMLLARARLALALVGISITLTVYALGATSAVEMTVVNATVALLHGAEELRETTWPRVVSASTAFLRDVTEAVLTAQSRTAPPTPPTPPPAPPLPPTSPALLESLHSFIELHPIVFCSIVFCTSTLAGLVALFWEDLQESAPGALHWLKERLPRWCFAMNCCGRGGAAEYDELENYDNLDDGNLQDNLLQQCMQKIHDCNEMLKDKSALSRQSSFSASPRDDGARLPRSLADRVEELRPLCSKM